MRCGLLGGLCLFCGLLVISIFIVLFSQTSMCPLGTFRCQDNSTGVCLPRRLLCDGRNDCPNGSDEDRSKCHDIYGELDSLVDELNNRPAPTLPSPFYNSCALNPEEYPRGCICRNFTWLKCDGMKLKSVPRVGSVLRRILLMNNTIKRLTAQDLDGYDLEVIHLSDNKIESIEGDAFRQQRNLKKLYLTGNRLSDLSADTFIGLERMEWLFLQQNQLREMDMGVFGGLTSLRWLDLSHNQLTIKAGNIFPPSNSLLDLYLFENRIEMINKDTLAALSNLMLLDLKHNSIHYVDADAFVNLTQLKLLDLSYNLVEYIPQNLFRSQGNMTQLRLGFNPIIHLSPQLFRPLANLRSIGLQEIEIDDISVEMLAQSKHLDFAYFKSFLYCSYVAHANKCHPLSDGVSSFTDLISHQVHRAFLWFIGVLTLVGNGLVLGGRGLAKTENRILAMFVKNLAAADMCIGIYLLCIGERDVRFRGEYNQHAYYWMNSWECTTIRILAVSTSEVSLLLLTFMSVERFVSISHPFGERTLNFRTAFVSTALIWIVGGALALVPVLYWNEMGRHHGSNGLCFPLHIHEPSALGWQYSAFLYIGINGSCVLVIVGVYTALFLSIRRTRSSTPLAPNEIEIAVRFFFIVFTDCLCWMPTIVLKIVSLSDIYVPADLYAWLVVFILPVNSAINPFLYTFTTPTFRAAVRDFCRRVTVDWTSAATNSIALTGARSSIRQHDYPSSILPNTGLTDEDRPVDVLHVDTSAEVTMLFETNAAKWRGGQGSKPTSHHFIVGESL